METQTPQLACGIILPEEQISLIGEGKKTTIHLPLEHRVADWQSVYNYRDSTFGRIGEDFESNPFVCPYVNPSDQLAISGPDQKQRLFVQITAVTAKHLMDLSEEDARLEGAEKMLADHFSHSYPCHKAGLKKLWKERHGLDCYYSYSHVWAIEICLIK